MTTVNPPAPESVVLQDPAASAMPRRGMLLVESVLLLAAGILFMQFLFSRAPVAEGMPGNDSFYHLQMARLMPEVGLVDTFPWLQYSYFMREGDGFVSHHYGFHIVLSVFLKVSRLFSTEDMLAGRLAVATFLGLNLVMFNLILVQGRVRWRFLWLMLFLFMPHQFFMRHAYVRAIGASCLFMLGLTWAILARRYLVAGLVITGFIHLYLGGVLYAPLIVVAFVAAGIWAPEVERRFDFRLILFTLGGWLLGVLTYPYRKGMLEFLQLQVFGTGLSPDIPVGREWKPYNDVWWFTTGLAGVTLMAWVISLMARLRWGPRLNRDETALVFLNFGFLVLTLKARRFIEYWPIFAVLSAAYMARPVNCALDDWCRSWLRRLGSSWRIALLVCGVVTAAGLAFVVYRRGDRGVATAWLLGPVILLVAAGWVVQAWRARGTRSGLAHAVPCVVGVAVLTPALLVTASPLFAEIQKSLRCKYDLDGVKEVMAKLEEVSEPGDIIFTDDWDIFPVFFYHNARNHYIVGLDPKFTHERRPDLWERFVRITRAEVPESRRVEMPGKDGEDSWVTVKSRLTDIRDVFHASWAITDRDHRSMARTLADAPELAERVFPPPGAPRAERAAYTLWRILPSDGTTPAPAPVTEPPQVVYLGDLTPVSGEPGRHFLRDQSFEGAPIRAGQRRHLHGLVTLQDSVVSFTVPEGVTMFEATVDVAGDDAACRALHAAVLIDDEDAFQFSGESDDERPAKVQLTVKAGQTITLRTDLSARDMECGITWASARFVRSGQP